MNQIGKAKHKAEMIGWSILLGIVIIIIAFNIPVPQKQVDTVYDGITTSQSVIVDADYSFIHTL